ncbi:MAG: SDR family NAD(P)-dependent oxidoreductase [Bradyrhizobium sp.]|nr:SDR family NAD(P)-dependent oxidoreductase [Bradyrhizobium sp.]
MKSVVVTGASTGIGFACSKLLLARGFRVFGSVRNPLDAERLRTELGANFTPLLFDVTDEAAVKAAAGEVRADRHDVANARVVGREGRTIYSLRYQAITAPDIGRQIRWDRRCMIEPDIASERFAAVLVLHQWS